MLKEAYVINGDTNLLIHGDRGFHYRLDFGYHSLMNMEKKSMSKKVALQIIQCVKDPLEQLK
ncbi:MAG: hypothetical protein PUF99_04795 [Bacilli bacterium]|nr:hypothetical protein [Bacilli bacterium]